jgi:hypothetical protein
MALQEYLRLKKKKLLHGTAFLLVKYFVYVDDDDEYKNSKCNLDNLGSSHTDVSRSGSSGSRHECIRRPMELGTSAITSLPSLLLHLKRLHPRAPLVES